MPDAQFDLVESYGTAPQSDWFHACIETRKPYVVVRTSENTADVMWDYVTLPPTCDQTLMRNAELFKAQVFAIFQKHCSVASSVRAKPTIVFFHNLTISKAKLAANELYDLIESLVENPAQSTDAATRQPVSPANFPSPQLETMPVSAGTRAQPPRTGQQQDNAVERFNLISAG